MPVSDWLKQETVRRQTAVQGSPQPLPPLTGLGAGEIPRPEAALKRMVSNQRRAERLIETGQYSGSDESFLTQIKNFGIDLFDKSGLDSVLEAIDRGRKVVGLAQQDNPLLNPMSGPVLKVLQVAQHGLDGADTRAGYEISPRDYLDVALGRTDVVAERMGESTADELLGINRDISGSAQMDAAGLFTTEFVQSLPSWDIPGLGLVDPRSLASYARFATAMSTDMGEDPLTLLTGGLGALGRTTARKGITAVLKGSMKTTTTLLKENPDDALRAIAEATRKGSISNVDAYAAKRVVVEAERLTKSGAAKNWDDAVEQAAGYRTKVEVYRKPEAGVKSTKIEVPLKDGEFVMGKGVYQEMNDRLAKIVELKEFDSTDDLWKVWKDYAKSHTEVLYTTGGLRAGIGFSSFEIPWVTSHTRGLVRKGQRVVTQSKRAKKLYESPYWATRQTKWTEWRSRLSKEAPESIRAAGGNSKFSYTAYMTTHVDAPKAALRALNLRSATQTVAITGKWKAVQREIVNAFGDDEGAKFMREYAESLNHGRVYDSSHIVGQPKLKKALEDFASEQQKMFDDAASVLREIDPELSKALTQANWRPLSFTDDFMIQMNEIQALKRDMLQIDPKRLKDSIEELADRLTPLAGREVTVRDVEVFLQVLDTFGDSVKRTRPFGETAEMNWRALGRTTQIVDDELVVTFESLANINESLMTTLKAVSELTKYKSSASKRMAKKSGTALELDPVKQMAKYIDDVATAVQERVIVGEARAFQLMGDPIKVLDVEAMHALLQEDRLLPQLRESIEAAIAKGDTAAVRQAWLEQHIVDIPLGKSGRTLRVSEVLMQDPDYALVVHDLQEAFAEMERVQAMFPGAFDREVKRLMALNLSESDAKSLARSYMLAGLQETEQQYVAQMHAVLYARQKPTVDALKAAGYRNIADLQDAVQAQYDSMIAATNQTIADYRRAYTERMAREVGDAPSIDLMNLADNDELLAQLDEVGRRQAKLTLKHAERVVADKKAKLAEAVQAKVSLGDQQILRAEVRQQELYLEALTSAVEDVPLRAHPVNRVTLEAGTNRTEFDVFSARINDPQVQVEGHFSGMKPSKGQQMATRIDRMTTADHALFFYHPSLASAGDDAFRLLRFRVTGEPVADKVLDPERWFRENMVSVGAGVYVPKDPLKSAIVVSELPMHQADQSAMVNAVHRELTRRSDELGRPLDITVEKVASAKKHSPVIVSQKQRRVEQVVTKKVLSDYPGFSKEEVVRAILALNSDRIVKVKATRTLPSPDVRRARLAGFTYDQETKRWWPTSVQDGRIIDESGKAQRVADIYTVLKLSPEDIDELTFNFPQFLDDELTKRFEATRLPDVPEVTTKKQQQARLGEQQFLGVESADPLAGRRVAEDLTELKAKRKRLEKQQEAIESRIDAAVSEEERLRITVDEYYTVSDELDAVRRDIQAKAASAEEFGTPAAARTSRRGDVETFGPSFDDMTTEAKFGYVPAERLDSLNAALKTALKDKGLDDVTISEIADDYFARLVAAEADVKNVGESLLAAANLGEVIHQQQRQAIDRLTYLFPTLPEADVAMFPAGTRVRMPDIPTLVENRIRFGFGSEGAPLPKGVRRRNVTYEVDRAVLQAREIQPLRRQSRKDIIRNWEAGAEHRDAMDWGGDAGPLHFQSPDQLRQRAAIDRAKSLEGREAWYNGQTHITISQTKEGKPRGAVDVGRGGGYLFTVGEGGELVPGKGFGNPYVVKGKKKQPQKGEVFVDTTRDAVARYEESLWQFAKDNPEHADRIADLSGKELSYYRGEGRSDFTHSEPLADAADYLKSIGYGTDRAAAGASPTRQRFQHLEVSTKGDDFGKQFSALNATFEEGEWAGRTVEDVWQKDIKQSGKGRPPKDKTLDSETAYRELWEQWADENPDLFRELAARVLAGERLTDRFSTPGSGQVSQARALSQIIHARYGEQAGIVNNIEVLTGGQIGADRIGLEVASELGLRTRGTAPKGMKTSKGSDPSLKAFGLTEHSSADYPPRTRQNVDDADVTVLYGKDMNSPGSRLTRNYAEKTAKPFIENPTPEQLDAFLREHNAQSVNIAGNRSLKDDQAVYDGLRLYAYGDEADQAAPDVPVAAAPPIERPTPPNRRPITRPLDDPLNVPDDKIRTWFRDRELEEKALYGDSDTFTMDTGLTRKWGKGEFSELGHEPPISYGPVGTSDWPEGKLGRGVSDPEMSIKRKPRRLEDFDLKREGTLPNQEQVRMTGEGKLRDYDELIARQDMTTFVAESLGAIFGRQTRSAADRLADGTADWVTQTVRDGATNIFHQEIRFPAVVRSLDEYVVNQERLADQIWQLHHGFTEPLFDPEFQRAMAIANDHHYWRTSPDLWEARHGVPVPDEYPVMSEDALFEVMEQFENEVSSMVALESVTRQSQTIAMQARATQTQNLTDALRALKDAQKITDLDARMAETERILSEIGEQQDILDSAVRTIFGPDAQLGVVRDSGDGPLLTVDFPFSDKAKLDADYGGSFDEALQAMIDGDLSPVDAYRSGLSHVAKAYEAQQALDELVEGEVKSANFLAEQARKENVREYFRTVLDEAQSAIDRRNTNKLRKLVAHRRSNGRYETTKQFEELMESFAGTPEHQEFLGRFIEAAWVADLKEWPSDEAFRAWWLEERRTVATLSWSMDKNVELINRETRKMLAAEHALFPEEEWSDFQRLAKDFLGGITQLDERAVRTNMNMADPKYVAGLGQQPTLEAQTAAIRMSKYDARRVAEGDAYWTTLNKLYSRLDEMLNRSGDSVASLLDMDETRRLHKHLENVLASEKPTMDIPPLNMRLAEEVGLGAGITAGQAIDPLFAQLLESTVNNASTLFTPYVVSELQRTMRSLVNWWKAAATVSRPSFHIRNLIGGITNGYIIGVSADEYVPMAKQVFTFRKRLKRLERLGADDITGDVFEREVIQYLPEKYQDVFRQAWEDNVLQTSFTRAEELYDVSRTKWLKDGGWKPWDRNFVAFQAGGRVMETFEDVMRMTAFNHHYTKQLPGLGDKAAATAYAHQMVNVAHFDYTSLTPLEQSIKKFMPFYVWTRRNIPLQLRVLTQNPTFMLWHARSRSNWNEQQLQQMESIDPFTMYQAQQGFLLPTMRNNDEGWARLLWSPQLPAYDLDQLPIWDTSGGISPISMGSAFNAGAWASMILDNIGPGISLPMAMAEANENAGSANAKAGMNAVLSFLDKIPVVNTIVPDAKPAPDKGFAPDHDYRIAKWLGVAINTAIPFYDDYRAMLGIKPNSPYRGAGEGWLPGEDPAGLDDLDTRIMLGPLGRVIGRGAGFGWSTPTDAMFDAYATSDKLTDMEQSLRFRMGSQPDEDESREETAQELLARLGF